MVKELETRLERVEKRISDIEKEIEILKAGNQTSSLSDIVDNSQISINVPEDLIEKIIALDERSQIPILWYHSNKPIMSVKEFLTACTKKGFTLSHSWLPSAGGYFAGTFVKKQKLFHEVKGNVKSKEKLWKLTDVGKFKISKTISEMKSK